MATHTVKPRILFLFSDTGGGHRSAAESIIEALNLEFPGKFRTEMVDFFTDYAPPPLDRAKEVYPPITRMPEMWELGYKMSNGKRRTEALTTMLWPYYRSAAQRLVDENPCDIFVSVHPVSNGPILRVLRPGNNCPYITVVTDMVTTHAFWYHPWADKIFVPTPIARQRGINYGISPEKIEVVGQPVAARFCQPLGDQQALRARLGWPQHLPVVLLVGGGEGMGPLEEIAGAINTAELEAFLAVVAGRNHRLKSNLEALAWKKPAHIYGFVREMPDFMRAADILITKAGPGTISEAFIAGLPILMYSRLPGQEDGNVTYVVDQGAGEWAPEPFRLVEILRTWLEFPKLRLQIAEASRRLAQPDAARRIARGIAAFAS